MPRRDDIESILILGSGPIVIGQACEFDYSGTQACRVLREEGYRVILANSNPATIMTDPDFADATYVEPLVPEVIERILDVEKPDAVLPTLGGQTALNLAMDLYNSGALDERGIELIGAKAEPIETAENRARFSEAMAEIGLDTPRSGIAHSMQEALEVIAEIGLPVVIRPAYILGGRGTGIASTPEEFERVVSVGLDASPITEVLIEESIAGWKEYELEVMRDHADNCVIICSIENVDPMGVHTGDSITVAPAQTLTDVEYQQMRDAAFAVMRRVGVETGGSNVQFAVDPDTGRQVVIEMNPRVSRSSALASKATGFPIAKMAARLAVGYTLDEIPNDITRRTPASFEPVIDYVVTKVPRWAFEKLPGVTDRLGTQMQSVGEAMAIGRTFPESLQKPLRSLELGRGGLNCDTGEAAYDAIATPELLARAAIGTPDRIYQVESLLRRGISIEEVQEATRIDPWFLDQMLLMVEEREALAALGGGSAALEAMTRRDWRRAKSLGFGDAQLAYLWGLGEAEVRSARLAAGVEVTYKTVDTCAAEFEADTPYHYGTYEDDSEVGASPRRKVIILGSGPNRIGQGIEFDYCCVHACFALADAGYETIMVNCNPETVSTDYDTSDRLYFEPLSNEGVLNVIDAERRSAAEGGGSLEGVIVSLGGQTPLKLADSLPPELVLGTPPASIDAAEDREEWASLCARLEIPQPAGGTATTLQEAHGIVERIGYPALVRPSYVLGGRAMEIVYGPDDLDSAWQAILGEGSLGREGGLSAERPVLVDRFLEDATEVDVDAIRDSAGEVIIGGIMEHVEEAGVHSGDSACVIPPVGLAADTVAVIEDYTRRIAAELEVCGLINVQYAVKRVGGPAGGAQVFVIEANPRASRTVPFVAKATGVPLVKVASRVMCGATLAELRTEGLLVPPSAGDHVAVKEAVLPWSRFPDVDALLGPEMRSTGEVMGIDDSVGMAFAKSQLAAGEVLPTSGTVFMSLADRDKATGLAAARRFTELGFGIVATAGTAAHFREAGLEVAAVVAKVSVPEGTGVAGSDAAGDAADAADGVELISGGAVQLVVNSPRGRGPRADGAHLRRAAAENKVPLLTTAAAALAAANGIAEWTNRELSVTSLQAHHARAAGSAVAGDPVPGAPVPGAPVPGAPVPGDDKKGADA
jgi:carbamoyl-phosphate synthase large subunit